MPDDMNKHKELFISESKSHIALMNKTLIALEKDPAQLKLFQQLMRAVHTFKSIAATMSRYKTVELCHLIEDLFVEIKKNSLPIKLCVDSFFECFDYFSENTKRFAENKHELDQFYLVEKLKKFLDPKTAHTPDKVSTINPIRLEKANSIEVKVERLDALMHTVEELLIQKISLELIQQDVTNKQLEQIIENLSKTINNLYLQIMQARLIPIKFVFDQFVRMTRDLAKLQNKKINFQFDGDNLELDRSLIDELVVSMTHLIRNAIDHGIEPPEVRAASNKTAQGNIYFRVYSKNDKAIIELSDDGAGLNLENIKKAAVASAMIPPDAGPREIQEAIFSGISTTTSATTLSGRGLGLAIVKQKMLSIGGNIEVKSELGKGTTFIISVPLKLTMVKVIFVKVNNEICAIPINEVVELAYFNPNDLKKLIKNQFLKLENGEIPIIHIGSILGHQHVQMPTQLIILKRNNTQIGLITDRLISTEEIINKPFVKASQARKGFSSIALSGDTKKLLILDINYIFDNKKELIQLSIKVLKDDKRSMFGEKSHVNL